MITSNNSKNKHVTKNQNTTTGKSKKVNKLRAKGKEKVATIQKFNSSLRTIVRKHTDKSRPQTDSEKSDESEINLDIHINHMEAQDKEEQENQVHINTINAIVPKPKKLWKIAFSCFISTSLLTSGPMFSAIGEFGNNVMRSRLGTEELAASGLILSTFPPLVLLTLVPIFGSPLIIKAELLKNKPKQIGKIFRQTIIMGGITHCLSLPLLVSMKYILIALQQSRVSANLVQDYYHAYLSGYPTEIFFTGFYSLLIGLNKSSFYSFSLLSKSATLLVSAYLLMYVAELGFTGSGFAFAIGCTMRDIMALLPTFLMPSYKKYQLYKITNIFSEFKNWQIKLWKEGVPIFIASTSMVVTIFTEGIFAGLLGKVALGATNISIQYNSITDLVNIGLFPAITLPMRKRIRQGRLEEARKYGNAGIFIGLLYTLILGVLVLSIPKQIARIFINTSNPDHDILINEAANMLRWTVPMTVFDTLRKNAAFALYGLEDRVFPTLVNLGASWLIAIPLMYLLSSVADLGPSALVGGLMVAYILSASLLLGRWHVKSHDKTLVQNNKKNGEASRRKSFSSESTSHSQNRNIMFSNQIENLENEEEEEEDPTMFYAIKSKCCIS